MQYECSTDNYCIYTQAIITERQLISDTCPYTRWGYNNKCSNSSVIQNVYIVLNVPSLSATSINTNKQWQSVSQKNQFKVIIFHHSLILSKQVRKCINGKQSWCILCLLVFKISVMGIKYVLLSKTSAWKLFSSWYILLSHTQDAHRQANTSSIIAWF
jgi:hypothetical protein